MKYKKLFFNLIVTLIGAICLIKKKYLFANNNSPKITIFLPVYNKEDYLERSISSLQNQTFKNIEIVAINDGSTDNSLKILKRLKQKDKRIKIFNNDRNRGPFYTRAMGILNSTGDYLMNLDADDKLVNNECLKKLYKYTKFYQTDIIQFLIQRVPLFENQTKYFSYLNKIQLNSPDFIITNKLVKKELYITAYQTLESRIFGPKWIIHDDNIWNTLIKKYAKSTEIIGEYIYYYKRNLDSLNFKMGSLLDLTSLIYRIDSYQKFDNNSDINTLKNKLNTTIKMINNNYLGYIFEETRNMLKHIIINFINANYNYLHKKYLKELNYNLIEITNKKYIILYDDKNILSFNSTYIKIINYLQSKKKKFLFIKENSLFKIINYIYPNDVLVGVIDYFYKNETKIIINLFRNNKYIALLNNKNVKYIYNKFENNPNFILKEIDDNLLNNFIF